MYECRVCGGKGWKLCDSCYGLPILKNRCKKCHGKVWLECWWCGGDGIDETAGPYPVYHEELGKWAIPSGWDELQEKKKRKKKGREEKKKKDW